MAALEMRARAELARKAVVVGGGPVGCLAALALAKSGWRVELYEGREGQSRRRTALCSPGVSL
jgi:2-polyprenyl-6-methoxyphenol hydroxylase-like FAD-dependent oxidoreductase